MEIIRTPLEGVLIIQPSVFKDSRGFFMETHNQRRYSELGLDRVFVQDNLSRSKNGVLRGMHFQVRRPQAKLMQIIRGAIYDVAVDVRVGSPDFGKWTGVLLTEDNMRQLFLPEGYAHGFCVLSPFADILYKCSDFYEPGDEGGVIWNDPDVGIDWSVSNPIISKKDAGLPGLGDIPEDGLPKYQKAN